MCFYLNVPKLGPNATPDGTEQPILCANSLADMKLFRSVINSLTAKFELFNKAEAAVVKAGSGSGNCEAAEFLFFRKRLVQMLAYAGKRFDYFTNASRTPQKDVRRD